jgi:serine/threonine protein kinase
MASEDLPSNRDFDILSHSLARQMIQAVSYVHSEGIAHRDIGPNNFCLSRDGLLVLIDFGIAIRQGDEKPGEMYFQVGTGFVSSSSFAFSEVSRRISCCTDHTERQSCCLERKTTMPKQ